MFKIGKVTHYYDKIKFTKGAEDLFEQSVKSIQIEHKKVDNASKGDVVGLEVDEETKEGAAVYKID